MKKQIEELIAAYNTIGVQTPEHIESAFWEILTDLRTLLSEPEQPKKRYFLVYYIICRSGFKGENYSKNEIFAIEMEDGRFPTEYHIKRFFDNDYLSFHITGIQELGEQDFLDWTA